MWYGEEHTHGRAATVVDGKEEIDERGEEPDKAGLNPRRDRNAPRTTRIHPDLCL